MAKRHPATLVGLDLGSMNTAVVIAQAVNDFQPRIVGVGESYTLGVRRGSVVDSEAASGSIRQALEKAGKIAGGRALPAYIGYSGLSITTRNCRVALKAGKHAGGRVHLQDIAADGIPAGEKLLAVLSTPGLLSILESGLISEVRTITACGRDFDSVIESARLAGLAVRDIIYSPLAAAEALLSPAEKELGTLLVDFGAAATTVSVIDRGLIRENAVLAVGGEHIIADLAIGLHISLTQAREILKQYQVNREAGQGCIDIIRVDGEKAVNVPADLVHSIITARVKEVLEMIAGAVVKFNYAGQLPGGVVLYGGVAEMGGLTSLVENSLRFPVRIGVPKDTGMDLGPRYANAFGLVKCGFAS
ncbi:rod shape-determining protein [Pelotomaculum terephthalicicum JT]|uniref:cell division protein FtsA n=1 Tax=Pelotomaculum TaxID=191373 RepID=UPI0009D46DC8|nr:MULTISPECIES: cell division FtsA domain-containing protein [Pelotomaculum]MCG9968071.1 rod shape-determining protein [Pelotomaculum terephthalicicum JT]OPX85630.1 MAG: Cell division protein FtsA [Pelotomaculum sp. PtaB.Bin117]OPY63998.1 MAG: Cell division protein FtsA [Pelotomaculum sp. PtaU1.Bin065]